MDFILTGHFKFLIDKLFNEKDETFDFEIHSQNSKIRCHKIVLSTSSPVFHAMIKKRMKEGLNSEVTLDQFSVVSIVHMLRFMYMQISPEKCVQNILLKDHAIDFVELLRMADYFQINQLKTLCEHSLFNVMRPEHALEYYDEAKKSNADMLMENCRQMIAKWSKIIMNNNKEWKNDLRKLDDIDLMLEMLETFKGQQCLQSYTHPLNRVTNSKNIYQEIVKSMEQSFSLLYNDEDTSDLTLVTDLSEKISIHKIVLKAHSPYFLQEVSSNNIISAHEKAAINFYYTGEIPKCEMKIMNLLELANLCNITVMMSHCEDSLIKTLSVDNVFERFIFA